MKRCCELQCWRKNANVLERQKVVCKTNDFAAKDLTGTVDINSKRGVSFFCFPYVIDGCVRVSMITILIKVSAKCHQVVS